MPTWQPLYPDAGFIEPIRDNIETLFKANETDSLKWANGNQEMKPYKAYHKALQYSTLWPIISIVPQSTQQTGPGDEVLPQIHNFLVEIADSGPSPDALASSVMRRVKAVNMIIITADMNVLKYGMNAAKIAIKDFWADSHEYEQFSNQAMTQYFQTGSLRVRVETIEAP